MSALPFERQLTYAEWMDEYPEGGAGNEPCRIDVLCPECGYPLRVVDDDEDVGYWYYRCPCGWHELDGVMARADAERLLARVMS